MLKTATLAAVVASSASAADLRRAPIGSIVEGEYIIRLTDHHSNAQKVRSAVQEIASKLGFDMKTRHVFAGLAEHGFAGFSANITAAGVAILSHMDAVEYIEENQVVNINDCVEQSDPDWGTTRTNIRGSYKDGPYDYTTGASGAGVDAYIIDTGYVLDNAVIPFIHFEHFLTN